MPTRDDHYARRRGYGTRIYKDDYFVVKHLRSYIETRTERLVTQGTRVADIGCGEQPTRGQIERLGAQYVGIDIVQNGSGTVDVLAPITEMPVPDGVFDVLLVTEVLEHVSDTYGAFRELARVLRPGGSIIITVPFAYPLHEEPWDFVRLTPYQIRECAKLNGLEVTELFTSGNELEVIATVIDNMWRRGIKGKANPLQRIFLPLSRLVVNPLVVLGNALFGKRLPHKYYLNTLCVLTKAA